LGALRVRLYAGTDPVTLRQVHLRATIPGTDKAAYRKADDKLSEFRTQVLKQRSPAAHVASHPGPDPLTPSQRTKSWKRHA
jgi:hypothetical protein